MTRTAADPPADRGGRAQRGLLRILPALTLAAVLTITASAEFELATTVLDQPPYIAWALPVAVDSYVLAALRSGRDVVPALTVMAGSLAASMSAHLAAAGSREALPGHVVAPAATGIMTVLVIVAWRVHVLIDHLTEHPEDREPTAPAESADPDEPVPADIAPGARTPPLGTTAPAADQPSEHGEPGATTVLALAAPPPPAAAVRGRTDEQILADIGAKPPSIRTLKRRYAIGQTRATRIHQAARQQAGSHQHENISSSHLKSIHPADHDNRIQESAGIEDPNTHTCITDRVGPESPPGDGSTAADEWPNGALSSGGATP